MTLREIDDALSAWNTRLGAASHNLLDLQAEPTYQLLTGSGDLPKVAITGITAARVEPALAEMLKIFHHFDLLYSMVARAAALRRDVPRFGGDQKVREIEQLLGGKSIQLPPVDVPLQQRTLLSGAKNVISLAPEEMLQVMIKAFAVAKNAVMAVDASWKELASLTARADSQLASLRGACPASELAEAAQALDEIKAKVQTDPFGAQADLDARIQPLLQRVEERVATAERLRQEVADGLIAARARLEMLAQLHQEAVAAAEIAQSGVVDGAALPAPLPEEKLAGLREWLDRLEKKRAEGPADAIATGLRNWNSAAEDCVAKERNALAANLAPVEARNELRGRIDALKAKARAYGVAEDRPLVELATKAEALLYTRPADVGRALAAVADYERVLNEVTRTDARR